MTEEDAKTKWCPFARVAFAPEAVNGCNRPFGHPYQACIGSACMAWRWSGWFLAEERNVHAAPPPTDPSVRLGFCGLAGAPR